MKIEHPADYRRKRAEQYPPVGDQLDAIWSAIEALANGHPIPNDSAVMLDRLRSLRERIPKP